MTSELRCALESLMRLAHVHDRADLVEAASGALRLLDGNQLRVVVMGEFKRGKSSLVNAMVDAPVCAVDDDVATAARLEVGFADPAGARRWSRPDPDGAVVVEDIAVGEAAAASCDPSSIVVRVGIPRRLLRSGMVLVDTPGVGGITSAASVVTSSSLTDAHAVLFVTDASQELTRAEADALVDATRRCARVTLVATKIDMYPAWRDIVDADRKHIAELGLGIPVIAVSSMLRTRALHADDPAVNEESGFPQLLKFLADDVVAAGAELAADGALQAARRVYAHLREPLVVELELLEAPDAGAAARAAVAEARRDAERFKERVAGWQQILSDGGTDLAAAVDQDLRERFRALVADADEVIEASDPDEMWHEFEPTLYRLTADALADNLDLLRERAGALARRLADAVADDESRLVFHDLDDEVEQAAGARRQEGGDGASSGARAQQAFRAGYGGAMPIMMVGGMALGVLGLGTLVLPLAAVAGVMAGRKALVDDRERRLGQRRQQARVAVKKYTDEAMFRAAAERKQTQRTVQRTLRDHFTARVKELAATRHEAIQRAEAVAYAGEQQRRERAAAVREELARVEQVAHELAGRT
jgi:signal recognition particle receptor subunit beta